MAIFKCEECGTNVSTEAAACPHCGHPNTVRNEKSIKRKSRRSTLPWGWQIVLIFGLVIFAIVSENNKKRGQDSAPDNISSLPIVEYSGTLYSKAVVNVRSGPSIDSEILRKAKRGESLKMDAQKGEWFRLAQSDSGGRKPWIHMSVVSASKPNSASNSIKEISSPFPKNSIVVSSTKVKKVGGKFRYFFDVRNKSGREYMGAVTITLHNKQPGTINGVETFVSHGIPPGLGTSVYIEIHTGPASVHGDFCVSTFSYVVKDDGREIDSSSGTISTAFESIGY